MLKHTTRPTYYIPHKYVNTINIQGPIRITIMDNNVPTSVEPDNSLTLRTVDTDKALEIQIVSFQNNRIYFFLVC